MPCGQWVGITRSIRDGRVTTRQGYNLFIELASRFLSPDSPGPLTSLRRSGPGQFVLCANAPADRACRIPAARIDIAPTP